MGVRRHRLRLHRAAHPRATEDHGNSRFGLPRGSAPSEVSATPGREPRCPTSAAEQPLEPTEETSVRTAGGRFLRYRWRVAGGRLRCCR